MAGEFVTTDLVRRRAVVAFPAMSGFEGFMPCERCGRFVNDYERHHRQYRSRGGLWTPSNIVLICGSCHRDATDEAPWAREHGYNVSQFQEPSQVPLKLWHAGLVLLDDQGGFTTI